MTEWIVPRTSKELPYVSEKQIAEEVKNDLNYLKDNTIPLPTSVQGDILYYNGTSWVVLAPGTSGYYLKTQGAAANPVWGAISTTNCVMRNGTNVAYASPSGTRVKGTVYQNTSGKIRDVAITIYGSQTQAGAYVYVGSANPPTYRTAQMYVATNSLDTTSHTFKVAPNEYYKLTQMNGTITVTDWVEWDIL